MAGCQPNLIIVVNREEVAILWVEIPYFTKRNFPSIPLVVTPVFHTTPLCGSRYFDLFMKDEEKVPIAGTKRGREVEFQVPKIPFVQALI